jgi:hypothetical protein
MLAEQLKTYLDKAGIHYAWVMAAIVFMFTLATSTITSAPQILILPITEPTDGIFQMYQLLQA